MASTGACLFPSIFRPDMVLSDGKFKSSSISVPCRRLAVSTSFDQASTTQTPASTSKTSADSFSENGRFEKKLEKAGTTASSVVRQSLKLEESPEEKRSLKNYFEQSMELIRSDGGPPRWFSPLECGSRLNNSPLLLFLPGVDGVGLGLIKHHRRLGKIFEIWCLHIPVMDRTPFTDLVKLVEKTIRSENNRSANRPIYLVGESLGACLALSVAARNPDIDLVLILANPATCYSKSPLQPLIPLFQVSPNSFHLTLPYILGLMKGDPLRIVMAGMEKGLPLEQTVGELSEDLVAMSSYLSATINVMIEPSKYFCRDYELPVRLSLGRYARGREMVQNYKVLANILPSETLVWKLQMLKTASAFANSRLHAVKAQALILSSGKDQLLPSLEEGERLECVLPKCEIRRFNDSGHFLYLDDDVDLVTVIKGASFYRRSRYLDYVSDYIPPTASEFRKIYDSYGLLNLATSPVMLSTLDDGEIVRGLDGIPSEGPVLFVGYHMLLGLELVPLVGRMLIERDIFVRGIAHPMMFTKSREGKLPELSSYDMFRMMGAVPVSAANLFKLLSSKSHVLLYPGGMREALHRKGETYKLFWPEQSEFVRMAARFGAKIVPFGAVGEDDVGELIFDYEDQMKIPYLRNFIKDITDEAAKVRADIGGEVANQDVHMPGILPKFPGRFYYYFGKPIETQGRKQELRDREKAHEVYLEVKNEVEKCLAYLTEKRESDPYRNLVPRLLYQATHGLTSEIPTFEI